jgi:hypothetical protein
MISTNRPIRSALALSISLALVAAPLSCTGVEPSPSRVLLVGVDGLEWQVLAPLLRDGQLPNLARLMSRGVYGRLVTIDPTVSPVVWTSIATGKPRDLHGIGGFSYRDASNRRRLFRSTDRRCKAFWNILSERDRTCHVIGWWITYPAEEIRGCMVSQYATSEQVFDVWKGTVVAGVEGQTYPPELMREIEPVLEEAGATADARMSELFGDPDASDLSPRERELAGKLVRQSRWSFRSDQVYLEVAEKILRTREDWDLFAVYFGMTDVIGHRFWRYYRPGDFRYRPSAESVRSFEDVVPASCRIVDEMIGSLLSLVDDDVTVIVVSDHGMHSFQENVDFDRIPDPEVADAISGHHFPADTAPGVLIAAGPPFRSEMPFPPEQIDLDRLPVIGSIAGVLPTLLHLLGLPVARDMGAEPMTYILTDEFLAAAPIEWIPTYETKGWRPPVVDVEGEDGEDDMMRRLENLGYLDPDPGWEKPAPPTDRRTE